MALPSMKSMRAMGIYLWARYMGTYPSYGGYTPQPMAHDADGPRPYLLDIEGRRWLLDGSGECA